MPYFEEEPNRPMDPASEPAFRLAAQDPDAKLSRPIFPIGEVGETVPESDPSGRFRNVLQNVQAAIRGGAGTIQLVLNQAHGQPTRFGPQAWGKDVREAMREQLLASQITLTGIELPTSLTNLSGLDQRQGRLSEETRRKSLDEVRNAINFLADMGQGGGVDVVSWEFPRPADTAPWNQGGNWKGAFIETPGVEAPKEITVVNTQTGQLSELREGIFVKTAWDPKEGKLLRNPDGSLNTDNVFQFTQSDIANFDRWARANPKDFAALGGERFLKEAGKDRPASFLLHEYFDTFKRRAEADLVEYERRVQNAKRTEEEGEEQLKKLQQQIAAAERARNAERKAELERVQGRLKEDIENAKRQRPLLEGGVEFEKRQIAEREKQLESLEFLDVEAKKRAIQSYAEAGLTAWRETHKRSDLHHPIFVGPEMGWPHAYGSHPQEFIELIDESRKKMIELLKKEQPNLSETRLKEEAETHIKGTFDTAHMGMWLSAFHKDKDGNLITDEHKRKELFSKWYGEQIDLLVKRHDTIGQIQLVDSREGMHGHLPAGQGELPNLREALEKFKSKGWRGHLVSEGHDEESFESGRIRTQTWKELGAPIEHFHPAGRAPIPWSSAYERAYLGNIVSPKQMFGGYTPPFGEYRPWAGGDQPISFE